MSVHAGTYHIKVKRKDIAKGGHDAQLIDGVFAGCPVGRAIRRVTKADTVCVYRSITLTFFDDAGRLDCKMTPEPVFEWIMDYDRSKVAEPIEFDLVVP